MTCRCTPPQTGCIKHCLNHNASPHLLSAPGEALQPPDKKLRAPLTQRQPASSALLSLQPQRTHCSHGHSRSVHMGYASSYLLLNSGTAHIGYSDVPTKHSAQTFCTPRLSAKHPLQSEQSQSFEFVDGLTHNVSPNRGKYLSRRFHTHHAETSQELQTSRRKS